MPLLSNSLLYKRPLTQLVLHSIFTGLWTLLPVNSDYIRMYIYRRSFKMWFLARWMSCSNQSNNAIFGMQWFTCNVAQLWTPMSTSWWLWCQWGSTNQGLVGYNTCIGFWHCLVKQCIVASIPHLYLQSTTCHAVLYFRFQLERCRSCLQQTSIHEEGSGYRWQSEKYPQ